MSLEPIDMMPRMETGLGRRMVAEESSTLCHRLMFEILDEDDSDHDPEHHMCWCRSGYYKDRAHKSSSRYSPEWPVPRFSRSDVDT